MYETGKAFQYGVGPFDAITIHTYLLSDFAKIEESSVINFKVIRVSTSSDK